MTRLRFSLLLASLMACTPSLEAPTLDTIPWSDLEVGVEETLREVEVALQGQPEDAGVWEEMGLRLMAHQLDGPADAALEHALALDPTLVEAASMSADLARYAGKDLALVLARYDRALGLTPDHAPLWVGRGDALADAGKDIEAEEAYQRALELQPDLLRAQARLGCLRVRTGRAAQGLELILPLLEQFPSDSPCAQAAAAAHAELGQDDQAREWASRARELDGEAVPLEDPRRIDMLSRQRSSWYLFQRARAAAERGDAPRAIADLTSALRSQPEAYNARTLLARLLLSQRRIREAEAELVQALETHAETPEALQLLGQIEHMDGRHRACIEHMLEAESLAPLDAQSQLALGSSYLLLEEPALALLHLEQATSLADLPEAWFRRAAAHEALGQAADAAKALQRASRLAPQDPRAMNKDGE